MLWLRFCDCYSPHAGQERFQGLGNAFFRGANACVLVFDITSEKSFNGLKSWHEAFLKQSNCQDPTTFPFVLVGNKLDQAARRTVSKRSAMEWAEGHGCIRYFEASAKDATGINEIFTDVAKIVLSGMEEGVYVLRSESRHQAFRLFFPYKCPILTQIRHPASSFFPTVTH